MWESPNIISLWKKVSDELVVKKSPLNSKLCLLKVYPEGSVTPGSESSLINICLLKQNDVYALYALEKINRLDGTLFCTVLLL